MCDRRQGCGRLWTLETRKELSPHPPAALPAGSPWDPFAQTPEHFKYQVKKKSRTPPVQLTWELKREVWAQALRYAFLFSQGQGSACGHFHLQPVLEVRKKDWAGHQDLPGHWGAKRVCKSKSFIKKIIEIL